MLPSGRRIKPKKRKRKTRNAPARRKSAAVKVKPYNPAKMFEPTYVVIPGKEKVVNDLRKVAATADAIYLAADPDREGEAICAHLTEVLTMSKEEFFRGIRCRAGGSLGPRSKARNGSGKTKAAEDSAEVETPVAE